MQIFVMRHGNAVPSGNIDAQRELTELGFQEARIMANWLNAENIQIDRVLVSPYRRAQQTAMAVIETLNKQVSSQTLDFITPSGSAKATHDYVDGLECNGNILIVSHMPLVSYLVAELTAGQASPIFQTAAIAQIDYHTQKMTGEFIRMVSPGDI